jgi:hypothetical protein
VRIYDQATSLNLLDQRLTHSERSTCENMMFNYFNGTFVASGTTTRLEFEGHQTDNQGFVIDDVSVMPDGPAGEVKVPSRAAAITPLPNVTSPVGRQVTVKLEDDNEISGRLVEESATVLVVIPNDASIDFLRIERAKVVFTMWSVAEKPRIPGPEQGTPYHPEPGPAQ